MNTRSKWFSRILWTLYKDGGVHLRRVCLHDTPHVLVSDIKQKVIMAMYTSQFHIDNWPGLYILFACGVPVLGSSRISLEIPNVPWRSLEFFPKIEMHVPGFCVIFFSVSALSIIPHAACVMFELARDRAKPMHTLETIYILPYSGKIKPMVFQLCRLSTPVCSFIVTRRHTLTLGEAISEDLAALILVFCIWDN